MAFCQPNRRFRRFCRAQRRLGHCPYARGAKTCGTTAHFMNEQLDQGPIDHTRNAHEMAQASRDAEEIVLIHALK